MYPKCNLKKLKLDSGLFVCLFIYFQAKVCPCLLLLPVSEVELRYMKPLSKHNMNLS